MKNRKGSPNSTKRAWLVVGGLFLSFLLQGQEGGCGKTSFGKEFWVSYLGALEVNPLEGSQPGVDKDVFKKNKLWLQLLSSDEAATITITQGSTSTSLILSPNNTVFTPAPVEHSDFELEKVLPSRAVHVTSTAPIQVVAYSGAEPPDYNVLESSSVLPVSKLGKSHLLLSVDRFSIYCIVATEDNTTVDILPRASSYNKTSWFSPSNNELSSLESNPEGQAFQVKMNKGDIYISRSYVGDFSGTTVNANKNIAVFAGNSYSEVFSGENLKNHLFEQMPPIKDWGTEFMLIPPQEGIYARFRIIALEDKTTLRVFERNSKDLIRFIRKGAVGSFNLNDAMFVQSDKPILVSTFGSNNKKPIFAIVPPLKDQINKAVVSAISFPPAPDKSYLMVMCKTNDKSEIYYNEQRLNDLDGFSGFKNFPQSSYSYGYYTSKSITASNNVIESRGIEGVQVLYFGEGNGTAIGHYLNYHSSTPSAILGSGTEKEYPGGYRLLYCDTNLVSLDLRAKVGFSNYTWKKNGQEILSTSNANKALHVTSSGQYTLTSQRGTCILEDTLTIIPYTPIEIRDSFFCNNVSASYSISNPLPLHTYTWSNGTVGTFSGIYNTVGTHFVKTTTSKGCTDNSPTLTRSYTDSFKLSLYPKPTVDLGASTVTKCRADEIKFGVAVSPWDKVTWDITGGFWDYLHPNKMDSIIVRNAGKVKVTVTTPCFTVTDSVDVYEFELSPQPFPEDSITRCGTQATLSSSSSGYTETHWYNQADPTSRLHTGTAYDAPVSGNYIREDFHRCETYRDTIHLSLEASPPQQFQLTEAAFPTPSYVNQPEVIVLCNSDDRTISLTNYDNTYSVVWAHLPNGQANWDTTHVAAGTVSPPSRVFNDPSESGVLIASSSNSCGRTADTLKIINRDDISVLHKRIYSSQDTLCWGVPTSAVASIDPSIAAKAVKERIWKVSWETIPLSPPIPPSGAASGTDDVPQDTLDLGNHNSHYLTRYHVQKKYYPVFQYYGCPTLQESSLGTTDSFYQHALPQLINLSDDTLICPNSKLQWSSYPRLDTIYWQPKFASITRQEPSSTNGNYTSPAITDSTYIVRKNVNACGQEVDTIHIYPAPQPVWTEQVSLLCAGTDLDVSTLIKNNKLPYTNIKYGYETTDFLNNKLSTSSDLDISTNIPGDPDNLREIVLQATCDGQTYRDTMQSYHYPSNLPDIADTTLCPTEKRYEALSYFATTYYTTFTKSPAGYKTLITSNGPGKKNTLILDVEGNYQFEISARQCGSLSKSYDVTVAFHNMPSNILADTFPLCTNDTAILRSHLPRGHPYSVTWSAQQGGSFFGSQDLTADTILTEAVGKYVLTINSRCWTFRDSTLLKKAIYHLFFPDYDTICPNETRTYVATHSPIDGVSWYKDNINNAVDKVARSYDISSPGDYFIGLVPPKNSVCQGDTQKMTIIELSDLTVNVPDDTVICTGESLTLKVDTAPTSDASFLWGSVDNDAIFSAPTSHSRTADSILIASTSLTNEADTFFVRLSNRCKTLNDTSIVHGFSSSPFLGKDTNLCHSTDITLNSPIWADSVRWYESSTSSPPQAIAAQYNVSTPGDYIAQVWSNCPTFTDTIKVKILPPLNASLPADQDICFGDSAKLYSKVGAFPIQWSGPKGFAESSDTIYAKSAGTYRLTLGGNCGTAFDEISISTSPVPQPIRIKNDTICPSGLLSYRVPPYYNQNYQWKELKRNTTLGTLAMQDLQDSGTYVVWAEHWFAKQKCFRDSDTFHIAHYATPQTVATLPQDTILCPTNVFTHTIPYANQVSIEWERNFTPLHSNPTLTVNDRDQEGIYSLRTSSPCGTGLDTISIKFLPLPFTNTNQKKESYCRGDRFTIHGANTAIFSSSYHKTTIDPTSPKGEGAFFSTSEEGQFFTVAQSINCPGYSDTDSILLSYHPTPKLSFVDDTVICRTDTFWLTVDTSKFIPTWPDRRFGEFNDSFYIHRTGIYPISLRSKFCPSLPEATDVVKATVMPFPSRNLLVDKNRIACSDKNILLRYDTTGLAPGVTTLWKVTGKGSIDQTHTLTHINGSQVVVKGQGAYKIHISNSCNDTTVDSIVVDTHQTPIINLPAQEELCVGSPLRLEAKVIPSDIYVEWSNLGRESNRFLTVTKAGNYTVTANNGMGCANSTSSKSINVVEYDPPQITLGEDILECTRDRVALGVSITSGQERDPLQYSISWETGNSFPNRPDSVWANSTGSYGVFLYHRCGIERDEVYVRILKPIYSNFPDTSFFCTGGSKVVTALPSTVIAWEHSQDTIVTKKLTQPGRYPFKLLSACNEDDDTLVLGQIDRPMIPMLETGLCIGVQEWIEILHPLIDYGSGKKFNDPTFSTLWNDGIVTRKRLISTPSLYGLKVTNFCLDTSLYIDKTLRLPPRLWGVRDTGMCGGDTLFIEVPENDKLLSVRVNNLLVTKFPLRFYSTGQYELSLTNQCATEKYSFNLNLSQMRGNLAQVPTHEPQTAIIQVSNGVPPYYYSYDNVKPQTKNIFSNVPLGEKWFRVRDALGCSDSIRINVIEPLLIPMPSFSPNGDGVNDRWEIVNLSTFINSTVYIYNRYGVEVKRLSSLDNKWDGYFNGKLLPPDDYWYVIMFEDGRQPMRGNVTLLR